LHSIQQTRQKNKASRFRELGSGWVFWLPLKKTQNRPLTYPETRKRTNLFIYKQYKYIFDFMKQIKLVIKCQRQIKITRIVKRRQRTTRRYITPTPTTEQLTLGEEPTKNEIKI